MRKDPKKVVLALGRGHQGNHHLREASLAGSTPEDSERTSSPRRAATPREGVALKRFKDLMKKNAGKLKFVGYSE